ncbi:hypothetical protein ACWF7W_31630, partial [Nonomuraea angiospora]
MTKPLFDEIIHAPNRLQICAMLAAVESTEFSTIHDILDLTEIAGRTAVGRSYPPLLRSRGQRWWGGERDRPTGFGSLPPVFPPPSTTPCPGVSPER